MEVVDKYLRSRERWRPRRRGRVMQRGFEHQRAQGIPILYAEVCRINLRIYHALHVLSRKPKVRNTGRNEPRGAAMVGEQGS